MFNKRVYYIDEIPQFMPDEAMSVYRKFEDGGVMKIASVDELVKLLFEDFPFASFASLGIDPDGGNEPPIVAFEIMLDAYEEGVLHTDEHGFIRMKDAALQLMFNEQNPNPIPDHAYILAYPETTISSADDIIILYDAEKARSAFEAWVSGVVYVDDCESRTYKLNEETGEYELQSDFDDSMV